MNDYGTILHIASLITVLGGAIVTIQKILKNSRIERDIQAAKTLQSMKEELALVKGKLDGKIELVKSDLKALEAGVNKDIFHVKETYNSEIKNLGEKIESLREQIAGQHSQMVQLLSKLIDNRD